MNKIELVMSFWENAASQNRKALKEYFLPQACVYWHNTNEQFAVDEYIIANCEYPGRWRCKVERIELIGDGAVTVTRVWTPDSSASFHAVSFFEFYNGKITALNEYWGDDGAAPRWRLNRHVGKPIK